MTEDEARHQEISSLIDAETVANAALKGACLAVTTVWVMVLIVYASADQVEYLFDSERDAAKIAVYMMVLSIGGLGTPFILEKLRGKPSTFSSIVLVGLMISTCAFFINSILAFCPTVVKEDKIVGSRVYLVRWCEWIPLSGLMTFLADVVSTTKRRGMLIPILVGLSQPISCIPGILFPFCESKLVWGALMVWAIVFYAALFPRLYYKYRIMRDTNWDLYETSIYERHRFGYQLLGLCTIVWTILVVLYFVNVVAIKTLPESHVLRHEAFNMFIDATFDVVAKAFYARLIVEVHTAAFAPKRVS